MSAVVRAGYKQTEVGVIPEEWDFSELGRLNPVVTSGSRGWAQYYSDMGSAFLRITNLSRKSIYIDLSDLKLVKLPPNDTEGLRTQLQIGDLLISITADIGIIGYVDPTVPTPAYINQHIALLRFDAAKIDTKFLSYFLASAGPQRGFRAGTDSGAKAGMNLAGVRSIRAVFPPLPEQRAIAIALSDVDALLAKLDALVAKKRDLKVAAMQQLLTGQTLLPGFSGKWEVKRLGEVVDLKNGYTFKSETYTSSGSYKVITIANVQDGYMVTEGCNTIAVIPSDIQPHQQLSIDDILISMTGNVGRVCQVCEVLCLLNQRVGKLVPTMVRSDFLFALLRQQSFITAMIGSAKGGAQLNLSATDIAGYEICIPVDDLEQSAIAAILSDMDTELATLESRRDKTQALKQGMMQELLTGSIRLVANGDL